jgi:arylsulfatase A-like enzyme
MTRYSPKARPFLLALAIFLLFHYGLGIWRLVTSSGGMENKFSALARDQHLLFLLEKNLYVGIAYLLLGLVAFVILRPFWSMIEQRYQPHRIWSVVRAIVVLTVVHAYFVLRLSATRPYFLQEAEYGQWYYHLCDWFPHWLNTAVFTLLPIAAVLSALLWHWKQWSHRPRTRLLCIAAPVLLFSTWMIKDRVPTPVANSPTTDKNAPLNVLIIGSDSLRGDRLGFTGYRPQRTDGAAAAGVSPTIDSLAARSQVFTRCFTPIASTLESNTSLHSSLYPHSHGFRQMYPGKEQVVSTTTRVQSIAGELKNAGYHTTAIGDWCAGFFEMMPLGHEDVSVSSFDSFKIYMTQAVIMAHFIVPLYFDHELGFAVFPEIESFAQFVTPEVVTKRVENKLTSVAKSGQPFFAHVFYSCNHLPYRTVEPYNSLFADPSYRGKNKTSVDFDIDEFIGGTDLENKWNKLTPEDAKQISALYDGCTRQFDDCVARILASLERNGLAERTIVIISSDHGDDLYEPGATLGHGLSFHGGDQTNHIPLVVYVPGKAPQTFPQIVRSIDVAPSLMDLLGQTAPASWEGKSFARWIDDHSSARSNPFYAETGFPFIQFRVENVQRPPLPPMDELTFIDEDYDYHFVLKPEYEQRVIDAKERMLRTEHWKLILTPQADGGRFFRLFDLRNDPHCERNVAAEKPDVLAPMKKALETWVDEKIESDIASIFPQGEP